MEPLRATKACGYRMHDAEPRIEAIVASRRLSAVGCARMVSIAEPLPRFGPDAEPQRIDIANMRSRVARLKLQAYLHRSNAGHRRNPYVDVEHRLRCPHVIAE
jgi:hypothetical protein